MREIKGENKTGSQADSTVRVLVVGQTPPPVHGQAMAIEALVNGPLDGVEVTFIRMHFSRSTHEIGRFGLKKVTHLASLVGRSLLALGRDRDLVLYYPPGSTMMPVLRDVVFLGLVRPLARATVLHFHAGGVSQFVQSRAWLRGIARRALGGAEAAIHLLPSATPDGQYFEARSIHHVPNGADVPLVPRSRPDDGELRLLFVGLHTESKGVRLVIETVRDLNQRGVPCHAHLVGEWCDGAEQHACEQLAARYGVLDRVVFRGRRTGAAKWQEYADADVFYFPTFYEAELMPLVIIEAMAYSLPVVASRWRCIPDVVQDGVTGHLFAPRDLEQAVALLAKLHEDPDRRAGLGAAGRERYQERYTLARHLAAMSAVFKEVGTV